MYVSRVEQGGPAWREGLRPGDLLLAADTTNFSSVTHAEAIAVSSPLSALTAAADVAAAATSAAVLAASHSIFLAVVFS